MPRVSVRERGDQFRRLVRSALTDLFDQRSPFGRLALTHVLMTAGDTMFAVSLAGSLFFSISPTEAKDKVLLYLLLTVGPFAIAAPALGPTIDASRGARRAMVVISALGRAALCPFLARDIHSLLLFPEAFAMLVFSKVYVVTKGALVPEMAAIGMLDGSPSTPSGSASSPLPPTTPVRAAAEGPEPTPPYGMPVIHVDDPDSGTDRVEPDLASLNARLGLLACLAGFLFALPAVAIYKLGGAPSVLWVLVGVFVAAAVAGARLPVPFRGRDRKSKSAPAVVLAPGEDTRWAEDAADLAALRPIADSQVLLALMPMSVLKALVGFTTFLFAFGLRRAGAATWWFGLVLAAFTAGSLIGVLLVARIRRVLDEPRMLAGSLWLVVVVAGIGAFYPARWFWAVVALSVGVAGAVAKPSFDALVQRHVSESNQGRAFARNETRFQLMWVAGSFVPVVLSLPVPGGNLVMAAAAATGAVFYMASWSSFRG
jgi:Na+/melibiose symporter-like transporter